MHCGTSGGQWSAGWDIGHVVGWDRLWEDRRRVVGPLLVSAPPPWPGPRPVVLRAPRAEDTAPPCRVDVDTTYGHQPRICVPDVYRTIGL